MKKLFNFLLVLAIGMALGYVFHDNIDAKLKTKFGDDKVETVKAEAKEKGEKLGDATKAGVETFKDSIDNEQ